MEERLVFTHFEFPLQRWETALLSGNSEWTSQGSQFLVP